MQTIFFKIIRQIRKHYQGAIIVTNLDPEFTNPIIIRQLNSHPEAQQIENLHFINLRRRPAYV